MANTWFRLHHDFLKDEKIIALAFEDQRHFIGVLILKSEGTLDKNTNIILLDRIVAQYLWIDHAIIVDVKKRLMTAGLIDELWQPLGWDKRQYESDKGTYNAEKQKRYRDKNKEEKVTRYHSVTTPLPSRYGTDTDTETDTEEIVAYLNDKASKKYKASCKTITALVNSKLKENYTLEDFKTVIDNKVTEWTGTEYEKYLRPETLFGNKFDKYLNETSTSTGVQQWC